jgi:hypothetical protein
MGGHAAWRKRVTAGELAKGSGGAALRHRPRLGRKGADLALNRLGNLGGRGNPKRKTTKKKAATNRDIPSCEPLAQSFPDQSNQPIWLKSLFILLLLLISALILSKYGGSYFKVNFITF